MGLFDSLITSFIGGNIGDILRKNCPASVLPALEKLLGNSEAVQAITSYVGACMQDPAKLSAENLKGLPLPDAAKQLLAGNPDLVSHLIATAKSRLGL